ncbi:hypothetical protein BUALT_Bualt11G0068400 [Buddleja alternifolia]|uniref:Pentatricopeptide repeat-containing protein n=1 Tax=Buddleja alternifolia TaxID=168488 RepID=A0AAV6X3Y9_9LAMI|nr:hypothetical protein BUALT_Bualt11G0068400 [Buddleja alternifolia]
MQAAKSGFLDFRDHASDGLKPTVDVYTAVVGAYALNGLFDKAFSIVKFHDCKPDAFTHSILIKSCIKLHCFDMVGLILKEMLDSGIEYCTVTYNILIDGYGKAKYFELMENSLNEMIQSGKCCPDIFTFNSLIGAYGNCGRIEEMKKWFNEFQLMGLKPDIVTYNILIKSYGNFGLYEKMGFVMEFMKKRFFSLTIVTYNIIIEVFGKEGDIEKMDEIFLKMKHQGGDVERMKEVLMAMEGCDTTGLQKLITESPEAEENTRLTRIIKRPNWLKDYTP